MRIMKSIVAALVLILVSAAVYAEPDTSSPLGVTYQATCLVVNKQGNSSGHQYNWVQARHLPNLEACQKFEDSLNARRLPYAGNTGLAQTITAADCGCDQMIERLRTKFYDTEVAQ